MIKTKNRLTKLEAALLVLFACIPLWGLWSLGEQQALSDKVVRLHILANSDSEDDQNLKLHVRDAMLSRAEAILTDAPDRAAAEEALRTALPELQAIAAQEIAERGYDYSVTAELADTTFPTREYDGFTLPAGEYLALRVVIGEGGGRNWWCVVFPPLCTAATTDVAQTAMAAGMSEDDVRLVTEEGGYVLKFKSIELWETLKSKLS